MPLRSVKGDVLLAVFVKPNRAKSALSGVRVSEGREAGATATELEVALAAPPVDGAANAELIAFLAKCLRTPKKKLELESGHASRHKVVRIQGTDIEAVRTALEAEARRVPIFTKKARRGHFE